MITREKVIVQVGNATKLHYAFQFELRGVLRTALGCGTKSIRGLRIVEIADTSRFEVCEKCEARGGGQ
jgi:hypothetical protein